MDQLKLKVRQIVRETTDTATIFLESADGKKIIYDAGQFLTFIFNREGHEIRRSYSFSSAPETDEFPAITIKRIPNGAISRFLLDHLQKGDILTALPASGRFTIDTGASLKRQVFFISAGSGIIPVFSLLKKIIKKEPLTRNTLIYQNRDEHSIIFSKPLHAMEKKNPGQLKWINLLSRPQKHPRASHRLTNFLLEKLVNTHLLTGREILFYLCGPPAFMRMAWFTLKQMGFTDDQIKKENFTIEYVPPPPLIADTGDKNIILHYQQKTFRFSVSYPTNILQAALNNGIQLPYSCRGGRCSTCVARCLKGKLKMSINEVLTEKDLRDGLVLTCVGYAETDLELSV
jgi:ring-1,2-phenylacetyl-CoA epoxidase subunit PaaE